MLRSPQTCSSVVAKRLLRAGILGQSPVQRGRCRGVPWMSGPLVPTSARAVAAAARGSTHSDSPSSAPLGIAAMVTLAGGGLAYWGEDGGGASFLDKTASCAYQRRIQDMYRLVDNPVGQGAFGVVMAGVHIETGEVVAIKQIPRKAIPPSRLESEVGMLKMAGQHKNVVNFRDFFSDDDEYYIVMEFATGGELFDRLVHKGAYSEHEAASFMREVVDALSYLHGHNIVHFDLKPENLLLASPEFDSIDVRLVDFGSAFLLEEGGKGTPRENSGTVAYSAPEVLLGEHFGPAADMWSLGVLMYILLSGVHPFDLTGSASDEDVRTSVPGVGRDLGGGQGPHPMASPPRPAPATHGG
ncbi:unnamed protein product [Discosporangium mesarthrocarpum]